MDSKDKIKIHNFDDLFPYIGGLGVYQFAHLFIMCKYAIFWLSLIVILIPVLKASWKNNDPSLQEPPIGCNQYIRSVHAA